MKNKTTFYLEFVLVLLRNAERPFADELVNSFEQRIVVRTGGRNESGQDCGQVARGRRRREEVAIDPVVDAHRDVLK